MQRMCPRLQSPLPRPGFVKNACSLSAAAHSESAAAAQLELGVVPGAKICFVKVEREARLSRRAPSTSPIREPWRPRTLSACPPWQLHLARGHGPMARGGSPRPGSIPGRARATLPACAAFPRAFSLTSLNLETQTFTRYLVLLRRFDVPIGTAHDENACRRSPTTQPPARARGRSVGRTGGRAGGWSVGRSRARAREHLESLV